MLSSRVIYTDIGELVISSDDYGLVSVCPIEFSSVSLCECNNHILNLTEKWFENYFSGMETEIPKLSFHGTKFQVEVWKQLLKIPFGMTVTYGDIASSLGLGRMACRAVGQAVKHNPLMIIVPCHRVIGANGNITGFAYGIELKRKLLYFEKTKL